MLGDHEIDAVLYAGYKYIKTMKREETPATAYLVNILPIIALLGLQVASQSIVSSSALASCSFLQGVRGPNQHTMPTAPTRVHFVHLAGNSKFRRDGQLIVTRLLGNQIGRPTKSLLIFVLSRVYLISKKN
jgi:hypothetical protein